MREKGPAALSLWRKDEESCDEEIAPRIISPAGRSKRTYAEVWPALSPIKFS